MFGLVEADLTEPLRLMGEHRARCGERLSVSGYVAGCLARTLAEFPELNAFRRGRSLVILDDIIVVVLLERGADGESSIGYLPIHHADTKSVAEITREIRAEQASPPRVYAGQRLLDRMPRPLIPLVMRLITRKNIAWALRFGTAGVNNTGFGDLPGWGFAPGVGTVAVTIGGITRRTLPDHTERCTAHLTLAFDHDVVDGAPAARFAVRLLDQLASGRLIDSSATDLAETEATGQP